MVENTELSSDDPSVENMTQTSDADPSKSMNFFTIGTVLFVLMIGMVIGGMMGYYAGVNISNNNVENTSTDLEELYYDKETRIDENIHQTDLQADNEKSSKTDSIHKYQKTIDFATCSDTNEYQTYLPFGSTQLVISQNLDTVCQVDITNGMEGGYNVYRCDIPKSIGTVTINVERGTSLSHLGDYCKLYKSGNVFEDMR